MPPSPERHLAAADPVLGRLIARVGPCRLKATKASDTFQALAEAIVYQQLTGKAAATILRRVKGLFPPPFPTPRRVLARPDALLRGAGLSGGKIRALKDLARLTLEGTVPPIGVLEDLQDAEIVERLTCVHGIGPWTVHMLLIFRLGRPDVLPLTDYGVRKGFARIFRLKDLPTPERLLAHAERWRPHRSAASWYLWRALDLSCRGPNRLPKGI